MDEWILKSDGDYLVRRGSDSVKGAGVTEMNGTVSELRKGPTLPRDNGDVITAGDVGHVANPSSSSL